MQPSFEKKLPNGSILIYTLVNRKLDKFHVIEKNNKGKIVRFGEVCNPVVNLSNVAYYDPRTTEKREGQWVSFFDYPMGENPFNYISSKVSYISGHLEGPYFHYYSRKDKPGMNNLLREEGIYHDLMGCYSSMPNGKVRYIDMNNMEHFCMWKNGAPYEGEVITGYGSDLIWNESMSVYVVGKKKIENKKNIYTRKKIDLPFSLNDDATFNRFGLYPDENRLVVLHNEVKQR